MRYHFKTPGWALFPPCFQEKKEQWSCQKGPRLQAAFHCTNCARCVPEDRPVRS